MTGRHVPEDDERYVVICGATTDLSTLAQEGDHTFMPR